MGLLASDDTEIDDLISDDGSCFSISCKALFLVHEPRQDVCVEIAFERWLHKAHVAQCLNSALFQSDHVLLADDACNVLLVSIFALLLTSLLLNSTPILLGFEASLCCLETLGFNQFSVADLLILFLLLLHDVQLSLFKHFHACLLKRFLTQHVQHGLNFRIEIKELCLIFIDVGLLAVLLSWHFRLE